MNPALFFLATYVALWGVVLAFAGMADLAIYLGVQRELGAAGPVLLLLALPVFICWIIAKDDAGENK